MHPRDLWPIELADLLGAAYRQDRKLSRERPSLIVAAGRGAHLVVVDVSQAQHFSDRGCVTLELIGLDDLWAVVFTQPSGEEGFRRFGSSVPLQKTTLHEPVPVDRTPQPIPDPSSRRTDINQRPPGPEVDAPLCGWSDG